VHPQGTVSASREKQFPHLVAYSDVRDVGKAAKDWPQLNFIIYHSAYRWLARQARRRVTSFRKRGRIRVGFRFSPRFRKYGVNNVYGDLGQIFAWTVVAEPRLGAAVMGISAMAWATIMCVGHRRGVDRRDRVADRRLAPPRDSEDMQKKSVSNRSGRRRTVRSKTRFSAAPMPNSTTTRRSSARLENDRFAQIKGTYEKYGEGRSNLRYG